MMRGLLLLMDDRQPRLDVGGLRLFLRLFASVLLLASFAIGLWMLEQTMNSVVILRRDFVDVPFDGLQVDVWFYHDVAYVLLWLSYVGFVLLETAPWRRQLTLGRASASVLGFISVTAGLWLTQDTMNAVLSLNLTHVDFPFFVLKPDLYNARDAARLLVLLGFVGFYALSRATRND